VIEEGKPAPNFELQSDSGETVKLSELRGRPVVLYFYPKDDTPGCTTEACEFRDAYDVFRERGAEVLGVSPDDVRSHEKFKTKFELPFTLLADPDHAVAELERCFRKGAKGVGELGDKGLGEYYSSPVAGYGMHLNDVRMKPLLKKSGELVLPVSVHIAEPIWMYLPMDRHNDGLARARLHQSR